MLAYAYNGSYPLRAPGRICLSPPPLRRAAAAARPCRGGLCTPRCAARSSLGSEVPVAHVFQGSARWMTSMELGSPAQKGLLLHALRVHSHKVPHSAHKAPLRGLNDVCASASGCAPLHLELGAILATHRSYRILPSDSSPSQVHD